MVELNNIDDLHDKHEERWPDNSSDGAFPKSVWIYFTHRYEISDVHMFISVFFPSWLQTWCVSHEWKFYYKSQCSAEIYILRASVIPINEVKRGGKHFNGSVM